jgi:hypothetical protein
VGTWVGIAVVGRGVGGMLGVFDGPAVGVDDGDVVGLGVGLPGE